MSGDRVKEFTEFRQRMNERILAEPNQVVRRFFALDTQTYAAGALDVKTKELCGLVASMVLPAMLPSAHAALEAGAAAPGFAIDGAMGGEAFRFDLAQALKKGPVVVYFYPKAFTQGCTLEANAFAEAMDQYQALGATVIGVSGDDIATLKRFSVSECRGKFPVGADTDRSVMKAYQAVMPQREDFARRISYVITPDSKIAFAYESGSYEEHVPRTLAALKALDGGGRKR